MASQDTEPKVEEVTNATENVEEKMPELENQPREDKKVSKNEKKCKKALAKIGLKGQSGITRVTLKRRDGIIFVISNPEVFISPTSENSFVVLGELKMDEPKFDNLPTNLPQPTAKSAEKKETTKTSGGKVEEDKAEAHTHSDSCTHPQDEASDEPLDEEGLTPMHIDMVMQNANCTRAQAVKALRVTNNDMVNAIMHLSK